LRCLHQHRDGDWRKQNEGGGEACDLGHLLFPESVSLFDDFEMPCERSTDAFGREFSRARLVCKIAGASRRPSTGSG
jgi:hypothetical protein